MDSSVPSAEAAVLTQPIGAIDLPATTCVENRPGKYPPLVHRPVHSFLGNSEGPEQDTRGGPTFAERRNQGYRLRCSIGCVGARWCSFFSGVPPKTLTSRMWGQRCENRDGFVTKHFLSKVTEPNRQDSCHRRG
jgi:hypothetical protein